MAVDEIHVGDIGTKLRFKIQDGLTIVDISGASVKDILLEKPDKTVLTKAGVFTTNGVDGLLEYITLSGDLDTAGSWRAQASLILPSGSWKSSLADFTVHSNLA